MLDPHGRILNRGPTNTNTAPDFFGISRSILPSNPRALRYQLTNSDTRNCKRKLKINK